MAMGAIRGVLCAATKAIRAARPLAGGTCVLLFALAVGKMGGLYPEALPVAAGRGKFTGWKREIARRRAQGRRQQMTEAAWNGVLFAKPSLTFPSHCAVASVRAGAPVGRVEGAGRARCERASANGGSAVEIA